MAFTQTIALTAALIQAGAPGVPGPDSGGAGEPARAPAPRIHDGAIGDLAVVAVAHGVVDVRIDGRLDESVWHEAPMLTGFTQYDPVEGIPAVHATEVRVLVTADAIVFGIRAHDEADGIRSTLARRDGFGSTDDWVRIMLDTFNDGRRAFVFQVNPIGVQADGLWVEGRGGRGEPIDWNPDFLWRSAGRLDDGGYTVEFEVPFKSLRFPEAPSQDWGLQVARRVQRSGFSDSWAPTTSNEANKLAQAGNLLGLTNLDPGLFMEVNPFLTASRQGSWSEADQGIVNGPGSSDFGLNLTYGLTSNMTLDGTYNPDFSQVEADAGQITVNERFALYLTEKRPFFLEGTDVFALPERLVYTRSIANPVGAIKVSGKMGGTSVAYIGAVDESSSGDDPVVSLVRLRRDVGRSSSLGMVYTDRTTPGESFNRVAGADGRFVLARRYTVNIMGAVSADGATGGVTRWGSLFSADFNRTSRALTLGASFKDIAPEFQARSGFIRRTGVTQAGARTGYSWRGASGAILERIGASLDVDGVWNRDDFWSGGAPEEWQAGLTLSGSFRGNIGGFASWSRDSYDFSEGLYDGLFTREGGTLVPFAPSRALFQGLHTFRLRGWVRTWERVRGSFGASWSDAPLYDRLGVPADLASSFSTDVGVTLYPTSSLSMEAGGRHVRLRRKLDGSTYSTATIPRIQGRYQFSRSLFFRAVGEYASQERGDLQDPVTGAVVAYCESGECTNRSGSETNDFHIESLIGYEPSPGTVLFIGYSRAMRDVSAFRFQDVQTRSEGLFVKLSYRFRM